MKSSFKKLPGSQIELEVSLDQKEFEPYWKESYEKAMKAVDIKGFRPGAAPKEMAAKAVDQEKVFSEAANRAVRISLDEVAQDNNWTIIDAPKIELTDGQLGLKFKGTLTLFPEVKLGNYKKIAKKVFAEKKEVKAESDEIQKTIEWVRNSRAKTTLTARPAKTGDLIEADVETLADQKPVEGAQLKGDRFILGDSRLMVGFDKNLEGHSAGEKLEFSITAPADYWHKDLRGKKVDFKVNLISVFDRELPEVNDEFAKGLGKFNSVEELKKSISDGLMKEKADKEDERLRIKTIEEVIKDSEMEIPEIMIAKTLEGMVADAQPMIKAQGLKEEDVRAQLKDRARNNVATNLVIYKIAEAENLKPTEEEVQAEVDILTGRMERSVNPKEYYNYAYGLVQNRKIFEFLSKQL